MTLYSSYNNEKLLVLLAKNDTLAFTEIYNRYWKKILAVAYNRLKNNEEAEDITHDVFASLWGNRNRSKIECLENYLATAAKYSVLAKIKRNERQRLYNLSLEQAPVFDLPIESAIHYKKILEAVQKEIENLPQKCKLIFKYSRNEGMATKQIAGKLNISPKTVENQINKALKQLRRTAKTFIHFCWILFLFLFL